MATEEGGTTNYHCYSAGEGDHLRRYLRESKAALVERLLSVEQAYLESQQQLARLQFELLDQQQKAQKRHENTSF